MGHACEILTFPEKISTREISKKCGEWATYNCDLQETGGFGYEYLNVNFTTRIFDSYEEAKKYLDGTFGNYREIAVRYKEYPKIQPNKTISDLERRIMEYATRITEIDEPHYKGVAQATVKCKSCGSSLSTKFCGKTYYNSCPVCRAELRPESIMKKRESYQNTMYDLKEKLKSEEKKQNQKNSTKAQLYWAVACEVHC